MRCATPGSPRGLVDLGDTTLRRWAPDREHRRAQNAAAVVARPARWRPRSRSRCATAGARSCWAATARSSSASWPARCGRARAPRARVLRHAPRPEHAGDGDDRDARLDGRRAHARPPRHRPGGRRARAADADARARRRRAARRRRRARRSRPSGWRSRSTASGSIPIADVVADPRAAASRALALLDHERLLVHFDVDVVDFVDLPLSENTGLNIGMPFAAARAALAVARRRPARRRAHRHRAQPRARRGGRLDERRARRGARALWREGGPVAVGGLRPEYALLMLLGADHVHHRVDEREVRERLREVAEMAARSWCRSPRRSRPSGLACESSFSHSARRALDLADLAQRRDEPEGADRERALLARSARRRSRRPGSAARARPRSARRRSRARWCGCGRRRRAGSGRAASAAPTRRAPWSRSAG